MLPYVGAIASAVLGDTARFDQFRAILSHFRGPHCTKVGGSAYAEPTGRARCAPWAVRVHHRARHGHVPRQGLCYGLAAPLIAPWTVPRIVVALLHGTYLDVQLFVCA